MKSAKNVEDQLRAVGTLNRFVATKCSDEEEETGNHVNAQCTGKPEEHEDPNYEPPRKQICQESDKELCVKFYSVIESRRFLMLVRMFVIFTSSCEH